MPCPAPTRRPARSSAHSPVRSPACRPLLSALLLGAGLLTSSLACPDEAGGTADATPPAGVRPVETEPAPIGRDDTAKPASTGTGTRSPAFSGELRLGWRPQRANPASPLAAAEALQPGIAAAPRSSLLAESELRGQWRALSANVLLQSERPDGGPMQSHARVNELHASADLDAWQLSAGRKIVSWDVGYAWRPNDVVQQEERRQLSTTTPQGRPLLQAEHFGAEHATSLVWVNPQRQPRPDDEQRGADESALALRHYRRSGALDAYTFARLGQHTGASLGTAAAWVATEALEIHGSLRWLQRHDGLQLDPAAGSAPVSTNPWQMQTLGRATQALLGINWTGMAQQSLIAEWWWDGSAPSDTDWQGWSERNAALAALGARPGLPPAALAGVAGNLAWQATPLSGSNLRRQNVYLRAAWQPEPWTLAADLLVQPADAGRISSVSAKWQGDRVSVEAAWRRYGGPAEALAARLPSRQAGTLTAIWSF